MFYTMINTLVFSNVRRVLFTSELTSQFTLFRRVELIKKGLLKTVLVNPYSLNTLRNN
jgi:hypothetical protein